MPSFGYGVAGVAPYSRAVLVSFSQNSSSRRRCRPGPAPASSSRAPRNGCSIAIDRPRRRPPAIGLGAPTSHDQVLRNHAVGSTCSVSASGPALVTRTVISRSVGIGLGVVDLDDPVAVVVEHAGVEQLVLRVELAPPAVLGDQVVVRERRLRVVVAPAVPGVAGHGVEVPPVLLDVLAVVAPPRRSARTSAPSGSGRGRSTAPAPGTAAARRRRTRPGRPRPTGRPATGRGRAAGSPRPRRPRCSPRGPCPTGAR